MQSVREMIRFIGRARVRVIVKAIVRVRFRVMVGVIVGIIVGAIVIISLGFMLLLVLGSCLRFSSDRLRTLCTASPRAIFSRTFPLEDENVILCLFGFVQSQEEGKRR